MTRRMLAVTAVAIGLLGPAVAEAAVPVPTVTGPLPVSEASHPFGAAQYQMVPEDLSKDGYVEEEYFVSGLANVYEWPAAGPAVVRTPNAPYTTRILVRRPQSPARSSGNAIVEMLNPSNIMDLNIGWSVMREHMMRKGDTWVGITIRPIAVDALKRFDPARYAPVSFADPLPAAQRPCTITGAEANQERGLAWDMNSQVGAWIRSNATSNPLRGAINKVYGFGYSQTGGYLNTYANAIHKLATLESGAPVYDGYFITVAGGGFVGLTAINQCVPVPPVGDPRRETGNLGVPIMRAMSLSDFVSGIAGRRPDSDTPQDPYRHYEVAGMGHASPFELYYSARPQDMVKAGRTPPPVGCNEGPRSRFPTNIAFDAMLAQPRPLGADRHRAAARGADPARQQHDRGRRARQRGRRRPLALRRRADQHLVRHRDRRVVLLHRRLRTAVLGGEARAAVSEQGRLCGQGRRERARPGGTALHHRGRRPLHHAGGPLRLHARPGQRPVPAALLG